MNGENEPKGINRRKFLTASVAGLSSLALVACGQSDGGGQAGGTAGGQASAAAGGTSGGQASAAASTAANTAATQEAAGAAAGQANAALKGANLKWSTWGNAGELQRFQEYTADFNTRTGATAQLIPIPTDYEPKILTQLSGGSAPDLFYSGDATMSKLIASKQITDLTEMVSGPNSKSKPDEVVEGLWGPARTEDGKIWGMPVDCNPLVFWYNKQLLQDAGVTTMPVDLQKEGKWTWDALSEMTQKVVAAGKRGLVFEAWFGPTWGWVTTNGGKVFEGNNFIAVDDPKAAEAFQYVLDNLKAKTFTFSGTLPKGQGLDAMFLSQQAAFVVAGRWLLPQFKKAANLQYDIVTWPTNTGNKVEPATIATAYMVQNAKAANPEAAFAMLTDFVSSQGQVFRLQGGGNAVPSVKGADKVVSEGDLPTNWQAFLEARDVGYAVWPGMANFPGLSSDIEKAFSETFINGGEGKALVQKIADLVKKKQGAA